MTTYTAKLPNKNGLIDFTEQENKTWNTLITRQLTLIPNRACDEFLEGLEKLQLPHDRVPQCKDISKTLQALSGWSVVPVSALIPLHEFFYLLSQKQFPAASFIRIPEELDYLQEPDIFHELFGHCPFFAHKHYGDFIEKYAKAALSCDTKTQSILGRLFWYTIEFGLINTPSQGQRIFGAGILSSPQEIIYALDSTIPQRLKFDVLTALKTEYRYDIIQPLYFYLDNITDFLNLDILNIITLAKSIAENPFHENDFVIC